MADDGVRIEAETKTAETINMLIRYIGEIIYQVIYFGMLLGQAFMMNVLKIFCPVAFALVSYHLGPVRGANGSVSM